MLGLAADEVSPCWCQWYNMPVISPILLLLVNSETYQGLLCLVLAYVVLLAMACYAQVLLVVSCHPWIDHSSITSMIELNSSCRQSCCDSLVKQEQC